MPNDIATGAKWSIGAVLGTAALLAAAGAVSAACPALTAPVFKATALGAAVLTGRKV
jgi:hypothetical protein